MPAPASALLIYNSRASRAAGNISRAFERLSAGLRVTMSQCPGCAREMETCRQLMQRSDRVIVAGGDGTVHRILPLLLSADRPLAVLPMGTANDFARSVGLPATLEAACDVAAAGPLRRIDIGLVDGRPFLNVASIGLATAVTRAQSGARKRLWRLASYPLALARAVGTSRPFRGEIMMPGRTIEGLFLQASFGNGRYHGGGLQAGPDAAIDDGLLHVYTIAAARWWKLLPVAPALLLGLHGWSSSVRAFAVERAVVRTVRPRTVTADGEIVGTTEVGVELKVVRGALSVAVPGA